jgi:hypothetical protein
MFHNHEKVWAVDSPAGQPYRLHFPSRPDLPIPFSYRHQHETFGAILFHPIKKQQLRTC